MSSHTVLNLIDDVDDMAPKGGMAPHVQARFARIPLQLEQQGLSHFRLAPGYRLPFGHSHSEQEEVYVVLSGSARVKLDDEVVELDELDAVRIAPGVMRGLEAGDGGADVLALGAPNTENKDAERQLGWWEDEDEA